MKGRFNELNAVSLIVICVIFYTMFLAIIPVFSTSYTTSGAADVKTNAPQTVTDDFGRTVTLPNSAPQRIISLAPSNTEILYALGLADRIIGVTDYCDYPPEAKEKPKVGGYSDPNIEILVADKPDLILGTEAQSEDTYKLIEDKGLPIVGIYPHNIPEIMDSITLIGKMTGTEKEAARLVGDLEKRIKTITDKTDKLTAAEKPCVFYVIWNDPVMTAGKGTFINELISMAGGVNIFADQENYPTVSLENVIAANPGVIIAGSGMGEGEDLPYQFASTDSRLAGTDARQNSRVYGVDTSITGRPGPRIVDALQDFLECIHPELAK